MSLSHRPQVVGCCIDRPTYSLEPLIFPGSAPASPTISGHPLVTFSVIHLISIRSYISITFHYFSPSSSLTGDKYSSQCRISMQRTFDQLVLNYDRLKIFQMNTDNGLIMNPPVDSLSTSMSL